MDTAQSPIKGPGRPVGGEAGAGREALLEAAREILARRGLPRLTSKEVAGLAGVKPTLVNYYFGGRDGLLRALVAESSAERTTQLSEAVAGSESADEKLSIVMARLFAGFAEEPWFARLFFEQVMFAGDEELDRFVERSGRSTFDAIGSVLEAGGCEGSLREVDEMVALAAIGGICLFFGSATPLLQRLLGRDGLTPENAEELAKQAADVVMNGLRKKDDGR